MRTAMMSCIKVSDADVAICKQHFSSLLDARRMSFYFFRLLPRDAGLMTIRFNQEAGSVRHRPDIRSNFELTCNTPPQVDIFIYRNKERRGGARAGGVNGNRYRHDRIFLVVSAKRNAASGQRSNGNKPKPGEKRPEPKPDKKKLKPRREGDREPREPREPNAKKILSSFHMNEGSRLI